MKNINIDFIQTKLLFAIIISISQIYFLIVDGATFWIDMTSYVTLGDAMKSTTALTAFYQDSGRWIYSHLQPGMPLVWFILSYLPSYLRWPGIAIFQHTIAAFAIYYAFVTINTYWPSRAHIFLCAALCFFPFYQAMHNSFMTESISSSLIICAFALWIRLVMEVRPSYSIHIGILSCIFIVGQFRSYFALIIFLLAIVGLVGRNKVLKKYILIYLGCFALSATIFPMYRYIATNEFFLPSLGLNKLMSGLWMNLSPSQNVQRQIIDSHAFEGLDLNKTLHQGLDYNEMIDLAYSWRQINLSNSDIVKRGEKLGALLTSDGVTVYGKRVLMGLSGSGLILPYCFIPSSLMVYPGMTSKQMCNHLLNHYAYLSSLDAREHDILIRSFFIKPELLGIPGWEKSQQQIALMLKNYTNSTPIYFRDPLFLGHLVPDFWIICFFLSIWLIYKNNKRIAYGFLVMFIINFLVLFSVPLANIRYSYFLFPLSFLADSIALAIYSDKIIEKSKTLMHSLFNTVFL